MENRRPPLPNVSRPYNRVKAFQKPEEKPFHNKRQPNRRDRFEPQSERFYTKNEKFSRYDNRVDEKTNKLRSSPNRVNPKDRFVPKGKNPRLRVNESKPKIVSDMQVTDGKYAGKYLVSSTSQKVRPTARRIREVMFRILMRRVRAGRFLDLCAGAGTVGIEAISRGALISTFVERSAKMCSFIKKNLDALKIKPGHGEIFESEVVPFLKKMEKRRRYWDVVYFDPPYDADYNEVLEYFSRGAVLKPRGILVIEHHAEMFFPEKFGAMQRWRVVAQGETALSFYERIEANISLQNSKSGT